MRKAIFVMFLAVALGFSTLAHAALVDNGGGLIYDTDKNITWYDAAPVGRTWYNSMAWAASLTVGNTTAGSWRLPSTVDRSQQVGVWWGYDGTTTAGYNITTSEMRHLFYTELGNKGRYDVNGVEQSVYGRVNMGPFINLNSGWSGTEHVGAGVWNMDFNNGSQGATDPKFISVAMAVHSGNIGPNGPINPVPVPPTVWLLGSGLIGLVAQKIYGKQKRNTGIYQNW